MTFSWYLCIGIFLTASVQGKYIYSAVFQEKKKKKKMRIVKIFIKYFSLGLEDGDLGKAFLVRLSLRGSTCTASIIGDNWLLTAGHCIEDLFIQGGKYDVTRNTSYGDLQVYISDIPDHPDEYYVRYILIIKQNT